MNINRINIAMIVGGGVLAFFGYQETRLFLKAEAEPAQVTLAEVNANGVGENTHLTVADFDFIPEQIVVYGDEVGGQITTYDKCWVPCVPLGDDRVGPNVKLVLLCKNAKNDAQLQEILMADTVTGIVVNDIDGPSTKELNLMKDGFAGADFSSVYYLEVGRTPPGFGKLAAFFGGGFLIAAAGVVWMLKK